MIVNRILHRISAGLVLCCSGSLFADLPSPTAHYRLLPKATPPAALAQASKEATAGILIEPDRELRIWSKNHDAPVAIASMSKMMTALLVMESLNDRQDLSMKTVVTVSAYAESMGGRQVSLAEGEQFTVGELLKAIMIQSANDAAVSAAEAVTADGGISRFVVRMNRRSRRLGLRSAKFFNVHGLPGAKASLDNQASCSDMAALAIEVMGHEKLMRAAKTRRAVFRPGTKREVVMISGNGLLGKCQGVIGLKTGYTRRSGFCMTAVCVRDGITLVAVVTGFKEKQARDRFLADLFEWGFSIVPKEK